MAFEIEKKFILTDRQKVKLLEGAEFLGEKVFVDAYYDNEQFSLGMNDMWLRKRDNEFNLKIPMREQQGEMINKYHEVEGEMAIREIFAIPVVGTFEQDLESFGHKPFCIFQTKRKKYEKEGFIIDLDEADFGDWQYGLAEIELLVETKEEMKEAEERIYEFAKKHDLEIMHVRGKLLEFIKRKIPDFYARMIADGVAFENK
ncbi:MAG: thiamine triphosphatase-like protein [uncultured bacterium]|nr:MAG: thiamine triphosphatase-like protein [uncultured bacterium]